MFFNNHTVSKWKPLLWLTALLLMAVVSACGGSQPEKVALSAQVPPRRGTVDTLVGVQEAAVEILGVSIDKVVEDADFRHDLGATDDEMARLADAFDETFDITLTDEEVAGLTTVQSAVDLIESKQ